MKSASASLNKRVYEWDRAPAVFEQAGLFLPERRILARVGSACAGQPILDLGVGSGRTTGGLLEISSLYTGVDYSAAMIQRCRERYPHADFRVGDARDLAGLESDHYALVFFSFNGLDYVPDDQRQAALAEVGRVTRPGGWFAFSSHNLGFRVPPPWTRSNMEFSWNPWTTCRRAGRYVTGIFHYLRRARLRAERPGYAYRVDGGLNYRLVTYYSDPGEVARQLSAAGLALVWRLDDEGAEAPGLNDAAPWFYYLARKVRGEPAVSPAGPGSL